MSKVKPITHPCPTCKKPVEWNRDNLYRPFCSKRCQLIDLGEWADEKNRIPATDGDPLSEWDAEEL